MYSVNAFISWESLINRKRKTEIPIGAIYYPHICLDNDPSSIRWSVRFSITEMNERGESFIQLSILVNSKEAQNYCQKLVPGTTFKLIEGNIVVAHGCVI